MKKLCASLLIMFLSLGMVVTHAQNSVLSMTEGHAILREKFQKVFRTEDLPVVVRKEFACAAHENTFKMADPGQNFEATDVITNEETPRRRLIFAGVGKHFCYLYYEHGGIGLNDDIVLIRLSKGKAYYITHFYPEADVSTAIGLREQIRTHYFDSRDRNFM